jgi:MFS transporter, ACDE family, multidrug resistance protein
VLLGAGVLAATRGYLAHIDDPEDELAELIDEATAVTLSSDS